MCCVRPRRLGYPSKPCTTSFASCGFPPMSSGKTAETLGEYLRARGAPRLGFGSQILRVRYVGRVQNPGSKPGFKTRVQSVSHAAVSGVDFPGKSEACRCCGPLERAL